MITNHHSPVVADRLHLEVLASQRPPKTQLARWVQTRLDELAPGFLADCIARQEAAYGKEGKAAPLAGVVVGNHPALKAAFFHAVKAGQMQLRQQRHITEGIVIAGVSSDPIKLKTEDFISPLIVQGDGGNPVAFALGGPEVDTRAESALERLNNAPWTSVAVYDGEQEESRADSAARKEKTFAHADVDLLSHELRRDVYDAEGVTLPFAADVGLISQAAAAIASPKLREKVLTALDRAGEVQTTERLYFSGGQPAFRMRRCTPAAKWQPPEAVNSRVPASPLAGYSAFDDAPTPRAARFAVTPTGNLISALSHARLLEEQSALLSQHEQLLRDMKAALADGDISESSFYDQAREALLGNQTRRAQLDTTLADAVIGDVSDTNIGRALTICIDGQTRTVTLTDGHPRIGEVSVAAPLGRALLTAVGGEEFAVSTEKQVLTVRLSALN